MGERGISLLPVSDFDSPTGKGAFGTVEGKRIALGNTRFLREQHVEAKTLENDAGKLQEEGATAIYVAIDGQVAGVIGIADPIKSTTPRSPDWPRGAFAW